MGVLNRQLATVSISNLASLKLLIEEWPRWVKLIREITVDDEMPLFILGAKNCTSRVERGLSQRTAALPLVEPDMQISRIRLSRKAFVKGVHR